APADIVKKLNDAALAAMKTASVREKLEALGARIVSDDRASPQYLGQFVKEEIAKWAAPIKASGVSVEELHGGLRRGSPAPDIRLRVLRPTRGAARARCDAQRYRSRLRRDRFAARNLRPDGRQAGVRRFGVFKLRVHQPLRPRQLSLRGAPGISGAGVSS